MRAPGTRRVGRSSFALLLVVLSPGMAIAAEPAAGKVLSADEVVGFARAMETAVAKLDVSAATALIDWDALIDKVTAGIEAPDEFVKGFREGAIRKARSDDSIHGLIIKAVKESGSYSLLRVRDRGKSKTALFRLAFADSGGVNYHEYELARKPDGSIRANDVYVFYSGENLSKTLRRLYIPSAAAQNRGMIAKFLGSEADIVKGLPAIQQMAEAIKAGRPKEALDLFEKLPASLQKDKTALLVYLSAAQSLDDTIHAGAIERIRKEFPDDPCVDLHSIDGFMFAKQYDRSQAAIDRVDKSLGGDPFLNVLRASVYVLQKQFDKARTAAETAVEKCPDMIDCYWTLLSVELGSANYPGVVNTLKKVDSHFSVEFNDLTTDPDFAGFVGSPQFREWKTYLAGKAKAKAIEAKSK